MLSDTPDQINRDSRASWWHAVFESSEDALIVCDREGEIREANRRAVQLLQPIFNQESATIFQALTGPAIQRVKSVLARESTASEQVSSISLLPYAAVRTVVDLVISRLDSGHFLLAFKDASR